jgi:tripartite-type tricarboxylate transporter receptor subunit TctC
MTMNFRRLLSICLALAGLAAAPARADPISDFYAGKQIRIYIRAAPGGNYDVYSRLLGRYIVRHLPGNPGMLPYNMPGGGGLVALNYVANVAPRDGTVLTMITQSFPMDRALGLDKNLKVDLRTLNWIGNMSETNEFFFTAKSSLTKTLDDARRRETVVAATGIGSITTQLTALCNNVLGTRFKIVYGYPSGPDMTLAMERGEVEGRVSITWTSLHSSHADWIRDHKVNIIAQMGLRRNPELADVPNVLELVKDPLDRQVYEFLFARQ